MRPNSCRAPRLRTDPHRRSASTDNSTPFFLRLREVRSAGAPARFSTSRSLSTAGSFRETDERSLIQAIIKPSYHRRGLIIAAPDTRAMRSALEDAFDRVGEAVVTVVSDVADVPGIAYFGIDNYRAGRTAGFIMGRFARRPGRVMFLEWAQRLRRASTSELPVARCAQRFVPKSSLVIVRRSKPSMTTTTVASSQKSRRQCAQPSILQASITAALVRRGLRGHWSSLTRSTASPG